MNIKINMISLMMDVTTALHKRNGRHKISGSVLND
jgi:hypothetical protein